jgi:glycopeptide antibiotics resistance protein
VGTVLGYGLFRIFSRRSLKFGHKR